MSGQRGWVMVPAWLLEKKPTGNDVLVYCTLGSHGTWNPGSGKYESCKPSIELMCEETGLSRSTIKRSLNNLLGFNALERTPQFTPEGDLAPSLYRVVFGEVVEPAQVGSQVDLPPKAVQKRRTKGGRSTPGPTSGQGRTDGRSTDDPTVGPPVAHNQDPLNQDPLDQDSVPASQVRRGDENGDGQMRIDGGTDAPIGDREPTPNDVAMGIARSWVSVRAKNDCPIVMRGRKADPLMALRNLVLPALETDYTENEIKHALAYTDTGIPTPSQLDTALSAVRRGWRPAQGWRPGDGRGTASGRQGRGNGPMSGTNRHVDDMSPEQRSARNFVRGAARQSQYATENTEQRGAVA